MIDSSAWTDTVAHVVILTDSVNDGAKKMGISRHFDILPIRGVGDGKSFKCEDLPVALDVLARVSSMLIFGTYVPSGWVSFSIISAIFEEVSPSEVAVAPANVD